MIVVLEKEDDNTTTGAITEGITEPELGKEHLSFETPLDLEYMRRDLELPQFSTGVRHALLNKRSGEVWSQLLEELMLYYSR